MLSMQIVSADDDQSTDELVTTSVKTYTIPRQHRGRTDGQSPGAVLHDSTTLV